MQTRRGFTLVELAVVITIVGLLVGAVVQAQNLIWESRVAATLSQVEAYRGAVSMFKQVYIDLPGDMDGEDRLEGCNETCKPRDTSAIGDGYVGETSGWNFAQTGLGSTGSAQSENTLFWLHLYKAGLINDVNGQLMDNPDTTFRFGVTHPAAAIGGGFIVKHQRRQQRQAGAPAAVGGMQGLLLGLAKYPYASPGSSGGLDQTTAGNNLLRAKAAEAIDRKADDGYPAYGVVQAYGTTLSCFEGEPGVPGDYRYWAKNSTKDCGLLFQMFR